ESARGGDHVQETACGFTPGNCWYPDFPGTVGWQTGFEQYADVYFDKNRNGLFHWLFYAHANGWPRSPLPCLDSNKMPTDTDASGNCTVQSNPNFRVPTTLSGVAQLPGSKVLITLGLWDKIKFIGSTGAIIGTTLHEFGHNLELYHGGFAPTWNGQSLDREPQCKPNHLSIMSYLFQISGLLDDS